MKRLVLVLLCLMLIIGTASAATYPFIVGQYQGDTSDGGDITPQSPATICGMWGTTPFSGYASKYYVYGNNGPYHSTAAAPPIPEYLPTAMPGSGGPLFIYTITGAEGQAYFYELAVCNGIGVYGLPGRWWGYYPPVVANFTGTPLSGASPLTIQLNDTSSGSPASWLWTITNNFDSEVVTDTTQNPSFTFYDAGEYTVSLTATNAIDSDTETKTDYFTVGTQYTQIFRAFDRSSSLAIPGVLITISDGQTGTTDANGRVTLTMWNGNRTASGSKTGYSSPGPVVFTANSDGQIVNVPMDYTGAVTPTPVPTVIPGSPTASFTYGGNIGALPRTVTLTSTSTGSPTLYSWWYYPPGSASPFAMSSTTSSATFDALVEGVYSVGLYVENAVGDDDYSTIVIVQTTATPTVTVTATPTPTITVTPNPSGGGTVSWDKTTYVPEEVAVITYDIESSLWAMKSEYDFNIKIKNDVGVTISILPIDKTVSANRASTKSLTLSTATYPPRGYYAVLDMTPVIGGYVVTLADDYMALEGYVSLSGSVLSADTATPIGGATVTITQQGRTQTVTTDSNGYWSSSNNWVPGYQVTGTVSASGYTSQAITPFTPYLAKEYAGIIVPVWSEDVQPGTCAGSPWEARMGQSAVTLSDGIILMSGGASNPSIAAYNDVWKTTNYGSTWSLVNRSPGWEGRSGHKMLVMPDNSVVILGGSYQEYGIYYNDVWKSTDGGITWTEINAAADWAPRYNFGAVVTNEGYIVITGGTNGSNAALSDIWRSTDGGVTWTQVIVDPLDSWAGRLGHGMVITPSNTIVLAGGTTYYLNSFDDVWTSIDAGSTWTKVSDAMEMGVRYNFGMVSLSTGEIVISGGDGPYVMWVNPKTNSVWSSSDSGATWAQTTSNATWAARDFLSTVRTPSDRIIMVGGQAIGGNVGSNDTWTSTDEGATWVQTSSCNPVVYPDDTPIVQTSTTGYVTDYDTHSGIVGASIIISNNGTDTSATTGSGGSYTVTRDATPSAIEWYVSASGYYPQYYTSYQTAGAMKAVNMTLQEVVPFTPSSAIKIRGVVYSNVGGRPVIGATVSISNASHGGAFTTTTTSNAAGAYNVSGLLFGGTYDVFSSMSGFYNSPTSVVTAGV